MLFLQLAELSEGRNMSATKAPPERFEIVLVATSDRGGIRPEIRLRHFLKSAWRAWGLKCVEIKREGKSDE